MNKPTNSQITEAYVFNMYPCLQEWIQFVQQVFNNISSYDSASCVQISMISQAAMKTFDYIMMNDSNASVIRVSRMLNDLTETAWQSWVTFKAQSNVSNGIQSIQVMPDALQSIYNFNNWDSALNSNPSFNPPQQLNLILGGVIT